MEQKLFIGVGLVKEILFLAQLGFGVTPNPVHRVREDRWWKIYKTKVVLRGWFSIGNFIFGPAGLRGHTLPWLLGLGEQVVINLWHKSCSSGLVKYRNFYFWLSWASGSHLPWLPGQGAESENFIKQTSGLWREIWSDCNGQRVRALKGLLPGDPPEHHIIQY